MGTERLDKVIEKELGALREKGTLKGAETVITGIRSPRGGFGPRYHVAGQGYKEFLMMNSNSYLGLGLHPDVIAAGEQAEKRFGAGPGAVRFISGTSMPHVELEKRLAEFHHRQSAMIFSAAYSAVMGILPQLISRDSLVVSDELNHNSIINAIKLSRPGNKIIYRHLDMGELERILKENEGRTSRVIVVTDGIFSMRGDAAPLDRLSALCEEYQDRYDEGVISVLDDSHGVGALGETGRGTEEFCKARTDVLIATLGKSLGVNGGYVTAGRELIAYLKETSPFYIYSNPITPGEAAAAKKSIEILDSDEGRKLLKHMRELTLRLEDGLAGLGYETIAGPHPIVPLMIRDTDETAGLVRFLFSRGILATGIRYPVVPGGDESVRLQVSAGHTEKDIDYLLDVLEDYGKPHG